MFKATGCVLVGLMLASCSSIKSIEVPQDADQQVDGLTYFMPMKYFTVTITVATAASKTQITKVTFGTTPSYPDLSTQYVLRYGGNVFGKNTLDVTITESGLLSTAKSTTISNVADAFKNLASSTGVLRTHALDKARADTTCPTDGDHVFAYDGPGVYEACGMSITITAIGSDSDFAGHSRAKATEHSGIFYRQNLPYLMTASGTGLNSAAIVFSPSESRTHFLPISMTFFSNNAADFGFQEGVPNKYKQETEGELVALFKIPADVLAAYFAAVGSTLDAFKTNSSKEAEALAESLKLEVAKKKYEACIEAIKANDAARIKELSCQQ